MNAKSTFFKNIDRAENILNIIKIREVIQPLKRRPILARIAEVNPEGIIAAATELVDESVEIALPLLLVFSVSCLEHYLKQVGPEDKLKPMIRHWDGTVETRLTQDAHDIRIKRNIIVHSFERKVNKQAEWDAKDCGITCYTQGMTLQLDIEKVREDLDKLRLFAKAIDQIIQSVRFSS